MGIVRPLTLDRAGFFGQMPGDSAIRVRDREIAAAEDEGVEPGRRLARAR
jgi:hypothetical protein